MTPDEILADLLAIFRDTFDDASIEISRATTADDVEGWDSLTHIQLVSAVEEHFGIKFKLMEIMKFNHVGDMCDCIAKHVA